MFEYSKDNLGKHSGRFLATCYDGGGLSFEVDGLTGLLGLLGTVG